MNSEFIWLVVIFVILILIITFSDSFDSFWMTSLISTRSNNVSAKSFESLKI